MTTNEIAGFPAPDVANDGARTFEIVDVQQVQAEDFAAGIKRFSLRKKPKVRRFDVVIAGGGMGGIACAMRAAESGLKVAITEETDWLGGQMTSQGVSALDENRFIETSGGTRLYQELRMAIRSHYRQFTNDDKAVLAPLEDRLNPGNCWVSRLSFEPSVALDKIADLLHAHVRSGKISIFLRTKVLDARLRGNRVSSLLAVNLDRDQKFIELRCRFCIDATETGDLLPMLGVPYATGAESRAQTGEAHAPEFANPENVQDYTYPFVLELSTGDNTIAKPPLYDEYEAAGKFTFLGYKMFECAKKEGEDGTTRDLLPFWTYRRLIDKEVFAGSKWQADLSMINWEAHDVRGENIIDQPATDVSQRLAKGKALSLGFLYWLQTKAPRDDGGYGFPEFKRREDLLGTADGLSKYPYIRESRRVMALYTVKENDIAAATNSGERAKFFCDSVGIGLYPIDIHGHQDVPGAGQEASPFQIPLSSMVQRTVPNLLPACKNIGTTHVTNGAYRLHPVEWAIGEAAGVVAAFCIRHRTTPEQILKSKRRLRTIQRSLVEMGSPIFWFSDVPTYHVDFAAIQFLATTRLWPLSDTTLEFKPDTLVTIAEAIEILSNITRRSPSAKSAGLAADEHLTQKSLLAVLGDLNVDVSLSPESSQTDRITRAAFAGLAYKIAKLHANFGRR